MTYYAPIHRKTKLEQYTSDLEARFGKDRMNWKFVCPSCGYVASTADYKAAGAPEGAVGFSCIGRWLHNKVSDAFSGLPGPCNYAGGGLICINPVEIEGAHGNYFEIAPLEPQP